MFHTFLNFFCLECNHSLFSAYKWYHSRLFTFKQNVFMPISELKKTVELARQVQSYISNMNRWNLQFCNDYGLNYEEMGKLFQSTMAKVKSQIDEILSSEKASELQKEFEFLRMNFIARKNTVPFVDIANNDNFSYWGGQGNGMAIYHSKVAPMLSPTPTFFLEMVKEKGSIRLPLSGGWRVSVKYNKTANTYSITTQYSHYPETRENYDLEGAKEEMKRWL